MFFFVHYEKENKELCSTGCHCTSSSGKTFHFNDLKWRFSIAWCFVLYEIFKSIKRFAMKNNSLYPRPVKVGIKKLSRGLFCREIKPKHFSCFVFSCHGAIFLSRWNKTSDPQRVRKIWYIDQNHLQTVMGD